MHISTLDRAKESRNFEVVDSIFPNQNSKRKKIFKKWKRLSKNC